ncbi:MULTISPECIES: glutaredoxin family protein [Massilia]|uniref:Thioredoxin family protein n=1 Tax=Massilia violaceinigra TaxID=2045208 RepID=A0A2D2DMY5_9BURK|nr:MULTISPECIES: glutaredoxin family protein [Massilia]ATQ76344.1 thioredoxin family protein [Massilia violaceinigra]MDQ1816295.1 glutaredoxin family protein [Massilia sp. CCM 9210]MDQ1834819.1 glutaredoxin family protein [Massilia sp. CCM 9029]
MIRFTLYSRSYCHLCDDLLDALNALQTETVRFAVEVIDVDADPALVERFDELVPVLFGDPAGPELCHYFLDEAAVRAYLAASPVSI